MKFAALALALGLVSASASASEYDCQTKNEMFKAHFIFDDGPGGLDAVSLTFDDQEYSDYRAGQGIVKIVDRDNASGAYDYAGDFLAIGFDAKDGVKFDINAKRVDEEKFKGKLIITTAAKKTYWTLNCTEN